MEDSEKIVWTMSEVINALGDDISSIKSISLHNDILQYNDLSLADSNIFTAAAVSIDTRTLKDHEMFVSLQGQNNIGDAVVFNAIKKGSSIVLAHIENKVAIETDLHNSVSDLPLKTLCAIVYVKNGTLNSLVKMAQYKRENVNAKYIGITGSAGKTSTRFLITSVCDKDKRTCTFGMEKSYNNHIGLPLTLANVHKDDKYVVCEIASNHPGEIKPLAQILRPHIAVITNIYPVHIANYNSISDIAQEKSDILTALSEDGIAILNADDAFFDFLNNIAMKYIPEKNIFSVKLANDSQDNSNANVKILNIEYNEENDIKKSPSMNVTMKVQNKNGIFNDMFQKNIGAESIIVPVTTDLLGNHQGHYIGFATIIAGMFNISIEKLQQAVTNTHGISGRGKSSILCIDKEKNHYCKVIDESFNANMQSIIATLANIKILNTAPKEDKDNGNVVLVLGGISAEHGDPEYDVLLQSIISANIRDLFLIGDTVEPLYDLIKKGKYNINVMYYSKLDLLDKKLCDMTPYLDVKNAIRPNDIIFIKGSRKYAVDRIINYLLEKYDLLNYETAC